MKLVVLHMFNRYFIIHISEIFQEMVLSNLGVLIDLLLQGQGVAYLFDGLIHE